MPLRNSIRLKLPLAAGALLLLLGMALSSAAYVAMRRAVTENAESRLTTLTSQLLTTLGTNVTEAKTRLAATAANPAIRQFLRGALPRDRVIPAIQYTGTQPNLTMVTELRDSAGRVLLRVDSLGRPASVRMPPLGPGDGASLALGIPDLSQGDSAGFGRLRIEGDSIVYPLVARVPGPQGGFLVYWRKISRDSAQRGPIARLLGSDAAVYLGNADGTVWSDLGRPAKAPPIRGALPRGVARDSNPGTGLEVLASGTVIPGTPWVLLVEFPIDTVYGPAEAFLRRMMLITAIAVSIGVAIAWVLSYRFTHPLARLTEAAGQLSRGHTSQRVSLNRKDELGQLAGAFDAMAAQIEQIELHLDQLVGVRTAELDRALHTLREAQDSLVRREKLALLGQLTGGVGHELRNPLGIMSNGVYALNALLRDKAPEVKGYLQILQDQIVLASKIVDDLLGFSQTSAASRQAVGLDELLRTVMTRITVPANVSVHDQLPDTLPHVLVDPQQAGQVLFNLLTNAIQAIEETGTPGTIRLHGRQDNGVVALEVRDSGKGIAPADLPRVFQPLFTTKARGTGLGLAISRLFAQMNGGDLQVAPDGDGGSGATFVFTMPAAG